MPGVAGEICGLETCELCAGAYGWGCGGFGDGNFKWRQTLIIFWKQMLFRCGPMSYLLDS